MHELTIALRIREALETEFADDPEMFVTSVTIQVGALSGIVPEALEFAWSHAVFDCDFLADSNLVVDKVAATGFCQKCRENRTITNIQSFRCPICRTPIGDITGGDELDILTVDVRNSSDSP